jgi:hypothetical protein
MHINMEWKSGRSILDAVGGVAWGFCGWDYWLACGGQTGAGLKKH